LKLRRKIILTKGTKKIKIIRTKLKKLIYHKFVLRDQIENQKQLHKRVKKKNSEE
jgi:hypothetical protein